MQSIGIRGVFLSALKSLYHDDCIDCSINGVVTRPIYLRRGVKQGCPLSPILFSIYILDIGRRISLSNVGFKIGKVWINGLLYADDLVLIASSVSGLKKLIESVIKGFDTLKITDKSWKKSDYLSR